MPRVKVTSDYHVEIPPKVRDRIELVPGQEFKVHLHGDHILLVPVRSGDSGIRKSPTLATSSPAP